MQFRDPDLDLRDSEPVQAEGTNSISSLGRVTSRQNRLGLLLYRPSVLLSNTVSSDQPATLEISRYLDQVSILENFSFEAGGRVEIAKERRGEKADDKPRARPDKSKQIDNAIDRVCCCLKCSKGASHDLSVRFVANKSLDYETKNGIGPIPSHPSQVQTLTQTYIASHIFFFLSVFFFFFCN